MKKKYNNRRKKFRQKGRWYRGVTRNSIVSKDFSMLATTHKWAMIQMMLLLKAYKGVRFNYTPLEEWDMYWEVIQNNSIE